MSAQFKIRIYQSGDYDGATCPGTIVLPIARSFRILAESMDDAEDVLKEDVAEGRLSKGLVYGISEESMATESLRGLAAALDGSFSQVVLVPGAGMSSEFCRVSTPALLQR